MTPDELQAQEAQADRFVRRGELLQALTLYRQLVAAQPERQDLQQRMRQLAESMDPAELRAAAPPPQELAGGPGATPEEEGERLFQQGDFAGAAAAYRRALEAKPASELIQQRLLELIQLAQAERGRAPTARAALASAPTPGPAQRSPGPPRRPEGTDQWLRGLLERISERKQR